jgi:hypothetical protein
VGERRRNGVALLPQGALLDDQEVAVDLDHVPSLPSSQPITS